MRFSAGLDRAEETIANRSHEVNDTPEWISRGKSIRQLISELSTLEDQGLEVFMSLDGGKTLHGISLVGKHAGGCVLFNFEGDVS